MRSAISLVPIFAFLVILIVLSAVYAPVYTSDYAHHDDYTYFVVDRDEPNTHPFYKDELSNGRYLLGVFDVVSGWFIDSVADLRGLRFLSVVLLAFCGSICFGLLNQYFKNYLYALLAVVSLFTLPPFAVMAMWAFCAGKAFSLAFACLSFYCVRRALNNPRYSWRYSSLAVLLFIVALAFYPPGAMFYWFLCALLIFAERWNISNLSDRRIWLLSGIGFLAMEIYFGVVRLLEQSLGNVMNTLYNPYVLEARYSQKILWFI